MSRLHLGRLIVCAALIGQAGWESARGQGKDAKRDKSKETKQLEAPKAAGQETPGKSPPRDAAIRTPLDKLKLPKDAILVLIENAQEVAKFGTMYWVAPETLEKMAEQIRLLEQQLKPERGSVHACKLTGRLDGDYVALRAEFTFSTPQPRMAVPLGLQGGHLVDEGNLDGAAPLLEYGDGGFLVRVEKEGVHRLALNLKVPVTQRRSGLLGASSERGFELGLPGAPAGTLTLELPAAIKDIRVNDAIRKSAAPGRWELPLGLAKQLAVTWKEPQTVLGAGALPSFDAQVVVRLEETFTQIKAELTLEDPRGQTKEWRLLLPSGAVPTVKSLGATSHQWTTPDAKNPYHTLRLAEPTTERLAVAVQASVPRPVNRVAIGPFALAGSFRSQGTILVQAGPQALAGQRLVYHRFGEVVQRDLARETDGATALASFQFAGAPGGQTIAKAPVEIEFQASPSLVETQTEHAVRLLGNGEGWQIETTSKITAKALTESADFLEVQVPAPRLPSLALLQTMPAAAFPATAPWSALAPENGAKTVWAMPAEFRWEHEGQAGVAEPGKPARIRWRGGAKQMVVTLHGRYHVPGRVERLRLELPKPETVLDRGGGIVVSGGAHVEFLVGPPGSEEPAPERSRYQATHEVLPAHVDLVWRARQPDFAARAIADITIHERSAQVRQVLHFALPRREGALQPLQLRVPAEVGALAIVGGGKAVGQLDADAVWVQPAPDATGQCELIIEYDVPLLPKGPEQTARWLETALIWPEGATSHDAKVRVWCAPGSFPELATVPGAWRDRGVEIVPERDSVPALVVQASGADTSLALRIHDPGAAKLASLVGERTLIQVRLDDDGNQHYRVRYLVRKLAARELNIELPMAARGNLLAVRLGPDKQSKTLSWDDPVWNVAHVAIPAALAPTEAGPAILELEYKVPADQVVWLWQSTLRPPQFHGEVLLGGVRWQVDLPRDPVAVVVSGGAHLDYRWALQGWLLAPETPVTTAALEQWLTGKESAETGAALLTFWRQGTAPVYLLHVPRPVWLLMCSGVVLMIGLGLYLAPWGRLGVVLACFGIALAVLALALWWPATLPPVIFGSQPGVIVLAVLLGGQWLVQERYRRQVVFLPGFTRLQANSSLARAQGKKPREASTIDSPPIGRASGVSEVTSER
jgi:hypothetical protein